MGPITLVRVPHGVLVGHVVDLDGRSMKGVTVDARTVFGEVQDVAVTGEGGRFVLHPTSAHLRLGVELAGHVVAGHRDPVALEAGGWAPQEIVMTRSGILEMDLGPSAAANARSASGGGHQLRVVSSLDQFHKTPRLAFASMREARGRIKGRYSSIGFGATVLAGRETFESSHMLLAATS